MLLPIFFYNILWYFDIGSHLSVVCFPETGRALIHDLKSEVSGDFEKSLLILAEVQSNQFFWSCIIFKFIQISDAAV